MGRSALNRKNPGTEKPKLRVAVFMALAAVIGFGSIWAKASRYDAHAMPSPHFSTSVKLARVLFHNGLGDEPQALISTSLGVPRPDWNGIAVLGVRPLVAGTPPLPFQSLRAPPALA